MKADLEAAREKWISDAETDSEQAERERSDFLTYCDEDGCFADFHANRHTFITNLARAGVPLSTARKLARHSDPKLTSTIYTHLEVHDQAAAIQSLPSPPTDTPESDQSEPLQATGTDDRPVTLANSLPQPCHGSDTTRHTQAQTAPRTGETARHEWGKEKAASDDSESPQIVKLQGTWHSQAQVRAERTGFEPVDPFDRITGLANQRIRPLCHLSNCCANE